MAEKKNNRVEGVVTEALPNGFFRVRLNDGREIFAHLAGRMRVNFIRVGLNDAVVVELSPYDQSKGRIVYRKQS